jgi:hypothetical protein
MGLQPQSCNLFNLGEHMYKITIDLSTWGTDDEILTIETFDFDKIEIIKEFIEFQQEHGWAVDYAAVEEDDEEEDEDEESEDDEYFYDEESDAWYWYDAENDEWVELEEIEEDEEDEESDEEDEVVSNGDTYVFNITTTEEK